ncbi:MAG TPA: hypothetical protein VD757_01950 [Candidatus Nitrosocosmicus sp.]|nr:hypothetical protein [Candidatus Nitrosocosmicus sp.]
MLVEVFVLALLASSLTVLVFQHSRYQRVKKLYRADYARASLLKSISRLLPFMPSYKSRRYKAAEALIIDSGFKLSVEGFYLIKTALFIAGLVFFTSIQTTNIFMLYDSVINDLTLKRNLMDVSDRGGTERLELEREIFKYVNDMLPKEKAPLKELESSNNIKMYTDYLELRIGNKWDRLEEDAGDIAERMYAKLLKIRAIETDYTVYFKSMAAAVSLFFMPNIIGSVKLKLIEDKRDWEILNYIYVFSIFGRLPPFNIKNVLINILVISDIYKPILSEALNGVKSGKGEAVFDGLLKRVENQELYELLEAMRLSMNTGLLDMMDNIDGMAANQLKWLEIKSIKRRKSKQVIAMVPVVLAMLMAVVYFSYSLSTLSNPMNFVK